MGDPSLQNRHYFWGFSGEQRQVPAQKIQNFVEGSWGPAVPLHGRSKKQEEKAPSCPFLVPGMPTTAAQNEK